MEQVVLDLDGAARAVPTVPALVDASGLTARHAHGRVPLGPAAQLDAVRRVLEQAEAALGEVYADAQAAMRDPDLDDAGRRSALARLRAVAWRVVQHAVPLPDHVPQALRTLPGHRVCLEVRARLRRAAQAAFDAQVSWTLDVAQDRAGAPAWTRAVGGA